MGRRESKRKEDGERESECKNTITISLSVTHVQVGWGQMSDESAQLLVECHPNRSGYHCSKQSKRYNI